MKRARRTWTEEDKAEVRRLIYLQYTYAQIAVLFGSSNDAIENLVSRHRLVSKGCVNLNKSLRTKGRKLPADAVEKRRQRAIELWTRPEVREKYVAFQKRYSQTEEGKARVTKAQDARRGFTIPDDKREEYELFRSKRFTAREAAFMAGIRVSA